MDGEPILQLARGPTWKASDELSTLRLARGLARKALDGEPIPCLARGPTRKSSNEMPILRLARGWLGNNPVTSASTDLPDRASRPINVTNHSRDISQTTARHCGAADETESRIDAIPSRTGRSRGYRPLCSSTVPTTSARTTLCYLTPAPRTTQRGESRPGHCSLRISV